MRAGLSTIAHVTPLAAAAFSGKRSDRAAVLGAGLSSIAHVTPLAAAAFSGKRSDMAAVLGAGLSSIAHVRRAFPLAVGFGGSLTFRTVRWRFDPASLFRSWQRRLSRALCGIGGAEIEGSRRAFPVRRWQRRLSRALCGTSGAEIGGSQGFSSRCRLLRDWKSLLDIMDVIYSICHILPLSSSSISILIRSIL